MKNFKKFTVLVFAVMLFVSGLPVMNAQAANPGELEISKTYVNNETGDGPYGERTFEFKVEPVKNNQGLAEHNLTVTQPNPIKITEAKGTTNHGPETTTVDFNEILNNPTVSEGIYKYKVYEEKQPDAQGVNIQQVNLINGKEVSSESYFVVQVEVVNQNGLKIGAIVANKWVYDAEKQEFVMNEKKEPISFKNVRSAQPEMEKLILKKTVTGAAEKDKPYTFKIDFGKADFNDPQYLMVHYAADETKTERKIAVTAGVAEVTLKADERWEIEIDKSKNYIPTIEELNTTGYTVKIDDVEGTKTAPIDMNNGPKTVTFNNHKAPTTPTGVLVDVFPYVLAVGIVVAAGLIVFTKKRRTE